LPTHLVRDRWRIVEERNADLFFHYELRKLFHKYSESIAPLDILEPNANIPSIYADRRVSNLASESAVEYWNSIDYDFWTVLGSEIKSGLAVLRHTDAKVCDEIAYAAKCNKAQETQFDLSSSTEIHKISPKAVFFVLIGLLGGFIGFTSLFACLFLGGNWREVAWSISLAVFGVFIFHVGLFSLLT